MQETIMRTMDMQAERGKTTEQDKQHTKEVFDGVFEDLYARFGSDESCRLFDDVKPALERLRVGGHRLAVVSNSDERLRSILESLGILDKMDFVVVSSEVRCWCEEESFVDSKSALESNHMEHDPDSHFPKFLKSLRVCIKWISLWFPGR